MSTDQETHIIDPAVKTDIMDRLKNIEKTGNVRLLFAIESGSRAWGFPSPDSDYDVRFVYTHPVDWYLTIHPGRDVIEQPLEGIFDINGWDIKKALELLLKPNPVLLEWLSSPIKYMWDEQACNTLIGLAGKTAHARACIWHYLNLGGRQWRAYIEGRDNVNLKKYLYVVRPAMAIRWIRMNPELLPPMNFFELRNGIDLPEDLNLELDSIIARKLTSRELGEGPSVPAINRFILDEFAWAEAEAPSLPAEKKHVKQEADEIFRNLIKGP